MAPHGDADVETVAECLVILVQHLAAVVHKTQDRRMDHDVIGPAVLCMQRQLHDRIEVLVRCGNDDPRIAVTLVDGNLEIALALIEAHREELALLAGDEQALDVEIVYPVPDVRAQAGLIERQVFVEGVQCRRPDATHILAGVVFCFEFRILDGDTCY